jgi:hypothetical protein
MFELVLLSVFLQPSFAQTKAPALEGWHANDDTRSSWDILWTCLSTILACTWTALHMSVPKRNASGSQIFTKKVVYWIGSILFPELVLLNQASVEYRQARLTLAHFKSAQEAINNRRERDLSSEPPEMTTETDTNPSHLMDWTLTHGFCVNMRGLDLRSKDDKIYKVRSIHVEGLVKAGIIKSSQFTEQAIKDRAKADSFAKAITLLQIIWVTTNVIARPAYSLPITPIEISTLAFVFCAFVSYALWWHKPKDMVTPIVIDLPYNHNSEEMAPQLRSLLDKNREDFIPPPEPKPAEKEGWILWKLFVLVCKNPTRTWHAFMDPLNAPRQRASRASPPLEDGDGNENPRLLEEFMVNICILLSSLTFCGIHIAA